MCQAPYYAIESSLDPMRLVLYDPHFTDEETKAQRGEETCLRSHGWEVAKLYFEPGQLGPRACSHSLYSLESAVTFTGY